MAENDTGDGMIDMAILGPQIRVLRKARGMSTDELGRKVGFKDGGQIEHIEGGRRGTTIPRLRKIAVALGVTLELRLVPVAAEALDEHAIGLTLRLVDVLPKVPVPRRKILASQIETWEDELAEAQRQDDGTPRPGRG